MGIFIGELCKLIYFQLFGLDSLGQVIWTDRFTVRLTVCLWYTGGCTISSTVNCTVSFTISYKATSPLLTANILNVTNWTPTWWEKIIRQQGVNFVKNLIAINCSNFYSLHQNKQFHKNKQQWREIMTKHRMFISTNLNQPINFYTNIVHDVCDI